MKRMLIVGMLVIGSLLVAVPAQARQLDVFAQRTRTTIAHVGGWTRNYSRVFFIARVHSGDYNEPARAVVSIRCQGGFTRREFWNDHDGQFTRSLRIRNPHAQGRCTERIRAWTDTPDVTNGAVRITVALAVRS